MCKNLNFMLTLLCLSSIFTVIGADVVTWDFASNKNQDWGSPKGLTLKQENSCLTLSVTGWDSSIANNNTNIDPKKVSRFVIKYRASGFPSNTTGEIFFAADSMPAYHGDYYFSLPSLISDNQWHDIEANAEKDLKMGENSWSKFNRITKIRLDITNQFPGKIEIKSIQVLPPVKMPLQSLDSTNAQGILVPFKSFDNNFRVLTVPPGKYQLWARVKDDAMVLNELRRIKISGSGKFTLAEFLSSGGTLDFKWFKLGDLPVDGGNLTFSLPGKIDENYDSLLLTEQNDKIEDVVKSWPKKVKSEIVLNFEPQKWLEMDKYAPYWTGMMIYAPEDTGGMAYPHKFYVRRIFEVPTDLQSAWLQMMADDSFETYINGKKVTELQSIDWTNPQLADVKKYLVPGAKNVLAICYTNKGGPGGTLFDLVLNKQDGTFKKIVSDSTARSCASEQSDWTNTAFDDQTWLPVATKPAPPYDPWIKVLRYIDKAVSSGTVKCLTVDCPQKITFGNPLSVTLDLKCEPAIKKDEPIYVRLYSIKGKLVTYRSDKLIDLKSRLSEDGILHVTIDGFNLPEYGPGETYSMKFGVYGRIMAISDTLVNRQIEFSERSLDASPVVSKVVMIKGTPQLFVNDKPFYPVFGDVFIDMAESGFNKIPVNVRTFLAGGMANEWWTGPGKYDFTEIDRKINKLITDNSKALLVASILTQSPTWWNALHPSEVAKFSDGTAWEYYLATPTFSSSEYLKEACAAVTAFIQHCEKYYGGKFIGYNLCGGVSLEWQGWGCHTADQYDRMQDYSLAAERDFRQFVRKNYPATIKNINTLKVPLYKERFSRDGSAFRNPAADLPAIAYDQYYSESIANCIAKLAETAKSACGGKKIIGTYYGYAFEYGNMKFCVNSSGHNALNILLQSPDIDFILSPPSYGIRGIGNSGGDMKPFASIAAAGKLSILEDDTRTHITSPRDYYQTINKEQTSAILRRNFGMALSRKQPICLLPIEEGRDFNSPAVIKDIQTVKKAGDFIYQKQLAPASEIAVVIDEDATRYLSPEKRIMPLKNESLMWYDHSGNLLSSPRPSMYLTGELYYWQRITLTQIGAPVDYLLFSDIDKKIGKYKLWIILNGFRYNKGVAETVNRLKASGTTVLWLYAPGYAGENGLSEESMRLLTGINFKKFDKPEVPIIDIDNYSNPYIRNIKRPAFGVDYELNPLFYVDDKESETLGHYRNSKRPALTVKRSGNSSNFIFCGSNLVTPDLLTSIAQVAGVHIYTASEDNLFAGCNFLTIHAKSDGIKQVRLKNKTDVVDLFSGKTIADHVDSFKVKMDALTTRVFYIGDAKEFKDYMGYAE